ncbi:acid protease [Hortaea werneckii]|uniref:Peptidase A1 domain-containing protein n=1 Tax=Hortaea werneckii TaxID=91943 RepID=A0A3M7GEB4_HORWE|nr:acid protease [Hortaea werneckii]KAI6829029.1 acid protease [Hortaea werneckii]KAI6933342.1 acid protease [Hortaea werneckii]KAI6945716.1 acid protease [Hortaea werneckii]KAI6967907.1 acid protease [Hortaea werneckii]
MSRPSTPFPLVLAPSWSFDGDDGNWSSFLIEVGNPPQSFRVLPSTSVSEIWLPLPQGCQGIMSDVSDCGDRRGVNAINGAASPGFRTNVSSTWESIGLYKLEAEQALFGNNNDALYGLDTVSISLLGMSGQISPSSKIDSQTVAGYATGDFWLGSLGLGSAQANFTTENENIPSLITSLKAENLTGSTSFGYAAGASYASPADYGSLVIGGYDNARSQGDNLTIPLGGPENQTLGVAVVNILAENTANGTVSLWRDPSPLIATIDSTVSQLWLPQSVCDLFASTFGLEFDNTTGLYLVNATTHEQLLQSNPSISFMLGPNTTATSASAAADTINIVFPYAAFDLQADIPLYNSSTNYFPIRVAANESQYTLGRTFLQEAYLFVDWERRSMTISRVVHQNKTTEIVPVEPPSLHSSGGTAGGGLGTGAIVGIAVGVSAAIVFAVGMVVCFVVRPRRRRRAVAALAQKVEEDTNGFSSSDDKKKKGGWVNELDGDRITPSEIMSEQRHELSGGADNETMNEAMSTPLVEMFDAQVVGKDLEDTSRGADTQEREWKQRHVNEIFELP